MIEKMDAKKFVLRMLKNPVHCDETGGIYPDYIADNLEVYLNWDNTKFKSLLSMLENEGSIVMADDGHIYFNFDLNYPVDCKKYPDICASVMFNKHKYKCIEYRLKIKEEKLTFLNGIEDNTLQRIINKMLGYLEEDYTRDIELVYPVNHLNGFNELSQASGIIGHEYTIIKKIIWYSILSTLIADTELRLGRIKTDGRFSILIALGSGKGKSEFKSLIKDILLRMDVKCKELSSYHPDQFVGKVKIHYVKGNREAEKIKGFLSLDYLILDEALDLLTLKEPVYKESRRALRLGADGKEIYKKNVDAKISEGLSYETKCVFCLLAQPKALDSDFVLEGDARRFAIAYVNLHGVNQDEARLRNITDEEIDEYGCIVTFTDFMTDLNVPKNFTVSKVAKEKFKELYELLYQRGMNYSPKIADYTEINSFTMPNIFLKMCAIQALQENSSIINKKHVELAFIDYCEVLEHSYEYIENRITGVLNYEENWKGAGNKDQTILTWLYTEGATSSETSNISIADYKEKIKDVYGVKDRRANDILSNHRNKGWVESIQEQYNSKIWITFTPDQRVAPVAGSQPELNEKLQKEYYKIVNKYDIISDNKGFSNLQPCNHCIPEDDEILNMNQDIVKEIYKQKKDKKNTKYLIKAYKNDLESINHELDNSDDHKLINELLKTKGLYEKQIKKLKETLKNPTTIVNQPFTLIIQSELRGHKIKCMI